jgi:hypothetical protein
MDILNGASNHALQRTAAGRRDCNRRTSWLLSLRLAHLAEGVTLGMDFVALMSDWHPSYKAFFDGAGFDACLRVAVGQEAEVAQIAQLYQEPDEDTWDSHGFWRLRSSAVSPAKPDVPVDGGRDKRL